VTIRFPATFPSGFPPAFPSSGCTVCYGCIRGPPIYDLFKSANIPILPIQITVGTQSRIEHGYGHVSKLELATLLQVITSANHVHLPKLSRYSNAIRDEASQFELKIPEGGSLTFGAEGTSKMTSSWH
jgi:hypothetical protein